MATLKSRLERLERERPSNEANALIIFAGKNP